MSVRVSIVVATLNAASTLERCLESVTSQTCHDWELLVADGGSTDQSVAMLEAASPRIAWWDSTPDGGIYPAWNRALRQARGEYVMFLGADDTLADADAIGRAFAAIGGDDYDLVTARGVVVEADGRERPPYGAAWDHRRVTRRITVCQPGLMHRRDLFARFGGFDESYRICADYEFLLRLPDSIRALHVDDVRVRIGGNGISRTNRHRMMRETWRAQARCPRVGPVRASVNYADKVWRVPVGRLLGIPH